MSGLLTGTSDARVASSRNSLTGIRLPSLLPAYTNHRAATELEYATMLSRYPKPPSTAASAGTANWRVAASAVTRVTAATRVPRSQPGKRDLDPSRNSVDVGGDSGTSGSSDTCGSSRSSSAEVDEATGAKRRRLRLDPWRLCELLRRSGVGDPRAPPPSAPVRRHISCVRFHGNESGGTSGVARWFANRDAIYTATAARLRGGGPSRPSDRLACESGKAQAGYIRLRSMRGESVSSSVSDDRRSFGAGIAYGD